MPVLCEYANKAKFCIFSPHTVSCYGPRTLKKLLHKTGMPKWWKVSPFWDSMHIFSISKEGQSLPSVSLDPPQSQSTVQTMTTVKLQPQWHSLPFKSATFNKIRATKFQTSQRQSQLNICIITEQHRRNYVLHSTIISLIYYKMDAIKSRMQCSQHRSQAVISGMENNGFKIFQAKFLPISNRLTKKLHENYCCSLN